MRWCIIFSNIFEKQFKIDIALKLFGLSFSPFLWMGTILAILQMLGKILWVKTKSKKDIR